MTHLPSKLEVILNEIFGKKSLISATISSPRVAGGDQKLTIRPIVMQDKTVYQLTAYRNQQAFHQNLTDDACQLKIIECVGCFKQMLFCTDLADYHVLCNKKGEVTILKKPATKADRSLSLIHNRKKQYILPEGTPNSFLMALGIMSPEGKVHAKMSDKFKQINRFLELIEDVIPHLDRSRKIHIVDFGCGKAYLSFALYHYLKNIKGYDLQLHGLDLKADVIDKCNQLARELKYDDLHFSLGDINNYQTQDVVDMVVSLHACDTATDAALEKAIRWKAEVILCVPCCQHELFKQVQNDQLMPILKHGILKERFAALATDAARAQLLEMLGYQTQVLEFIDLEHTPKNLLIRAIRRKVSKGGKEDLDAYKAYVEALHITPSLQQRFSKELRF